VLTALAWLASMWMVAYPQTSANAILAAADTLTSPPVLANISRAPHTVEVNLTAGATKLALLPGSTPAVYAYNGMVPGPTLEANEGDRVIIHFRNNLPEPTTVHWHGLHIPADQDGSPLYPIQPGKSHDYVFTIPYGTAGTYWYHPHPHQHTGFQVAEGLYGAILIRSATDPLPKSLPEKVLILSDNRFRADGSIEVDDELSDKGQIDLVNGREGDTFFVSGKTTPVINIRPGEVQRWRIINASASRIYRLALGGEPFLQVGSDGGLFEHPVEMKEIVVANGERVELLVRGTGSQRTLVPLQALPYDRYVPQTRPSNWNKPFELATLRYSNDPTVTPPPIPATLRVIPVLDTLKATATRYISFSQGLINGRTMDMDRVDVSAKLGATEIWQVENLVGMDHPFHLHGFQFQILDRNGVPEKDRRWKDTVNIPKHQTARFIVRYDDFPGRWMFHCHILDHEDHGMMGILEVK
jgi:FtsP/CotA-like multicopper oxidase with cupredoxin domain